MATMIRKTCEQCRREFYARMAQQRFRGVRFCSLACFGVSRRKPKPSFEERRALKAEYDRKRREKLRDRIAAEKRAAYVANRDRILAQMREYRKTPDYRARMRAYLSEYWRRPGLKAEKKDYDRRFRAQKKFGPLWEVHYLTMLINDEVLARTSKYEIRLQSRTLNKALMRAREGKKNGKAERGYS